MLDHINPFNTGGNICVLQLADLHLDATQPFIALVIKCKKKRRGV